jgi:hypothetical protein
LTQGLPSYPGFTGRSSQKKRFFQKNRSD